MASYLLIGAVGFKVARKNKIKFVRDSIARHLLPGVGQLEFYFTARGQGRGKHLFAYPHGGDNPGPENLAPLWCSGLECGRLGSLECGRLLQIRVIPYVLNFQWHATILLSISSLLGHLRVALCLYVKTSFCAKPLLWKINCSVCSFSCKSISISWEKFCMRPRFDTEAQGNWELAYYLKIL